jgi:hypothetical protein
MKRKVLKHENKSFIVYETDETIVLLIALSEEYYAFSGKRLAIKQKK